MQANQSTKPPIYILFIYKYIYQSMRLVCDCAFSTWLLRYRSYQREGKWGKSFVFSQRLSKFCRMLFYGSDTFLPGNTQPKYSTVSHSKYSSKHCIRNCGSIKPLDGFSSHYARLIKSTKRTLATKSFVNANCTYAPKAKFSFCSTHDWSCKYGSINDIVSL